MCKKSVKMHFGLVCHAAFSGLICISNAYLNSNSILKFPVPRNFENTKFAEVYGLENEKNKRNTINIK